MGSSFYCLSSYWRQTNYSEPRKLKKCSTGLIYGGVAAVQRSAPDDVDAF